MIKDGIGLFVLAVFLRTETARPFLDRRWLRKEGLYRSRLGADVLRWLSWMSIIIQFYEKEYLFFLKGYIIITVAYSVSPDV